MISLRLAARRALRILSGASVVAAAMVAQAPSPAVAATLLYGDDFEQTQSGQRRPVGT